MIEIRFILHYLNYADKVVSFLSKHKLKRKVELASDRFMKSNRSFLIHYSPKSALNSLTIIPEMA